MNAIEKRELKQFAAEIRITLLEEMKARGFGHIGGSLSVCDLLAVLYGKVMNYKVEDPKWADRDKLVCSKGHAGPAVYATLALKGFFPKEELRRSQSKKMFEIIVEKEGMEFLGWREVPTFATATRTRPAAWTAPPALWARAPLRPWAWRWATPSRAARPARS